MSAKRKSKEAAIRDFLYNEDLVRSDLKTKWGKWHVLTLVKAKLAEVTSAKQTTRERVLMAQARMEGWNSALDQVKDFQIYMFRGQQSRWERTLDSLRKDADPPKRKRC